MADETVLATATVDPSLLGMLGRSLYRGHTCVIGVRELLQNSIDACVRKGVTPQIQITVERLSDKGFMLECVDNGCGMTPLDIRDKLLRLGGSSKRNEATAVGKFGIAKAIMMVNPMYEIQTLDWILDQDDIEHNRPIRTSGKHLDGTRITIMGDEKFSWSDTRKQIMQMIYLSDVDIHFLYKEDGEVKVIDPHAGLRQEIKTVAKTDRWSLSGCLDITLPDGTKMIGQTVYRLNGLVQYTDHWDRPTNLFFDIVPPTVDINNPEYPFTASRERLKGDMSYEIQKVVEEHSMNQVGSKEAFRSTPKKALKKKGRKLKGKRGEIPGLWNADRDNVDDLQDMMAGAIASITAHGKMDVRVSNGDLDSDALFFREYRGTPETADLHSAILEMWADVMVQVASVDEEFGVGLTGDEDEAAARYEDNEDIFYLVNAEKLEKINDPVIIFFTMWGMAVHEATHKYIRAHNDNFIAIEHGIRRITAITQASVMRQIVRKYAGRF